MIFTFLGDIAFNGIISERAELNNLRYTQVAQILKESEMVFANLEAPAKKDNTFNEHKSIIQYSLTEPTTDLLKMLNIKCVSLANNHIFDCKMSGLKETISILERNNILFSGAGWLPQHLEPAFFQKNNKKFAFMAYVDNCTNHHFHHFPQLLVNIFNTEKVCNDIQNIKNQVDFIILSLHWGVDYSYYPDPMQIETAQILTDAGADFIMGHHPHTIQPYKSIEDKHVFFSLGTFTFGDFTIKKNKPQALFRKTKHGIMVHYNYNEKVINFSSIREKKGNFITITQRNYQKWNIYKWKLFKIRYSSVFMNKLFLFKERVIDRVYEYFFGYYQKPFKRLFQFGNLKKIPKLFRNTQ